MAFNLIPEYPPGHPAGGACISCRAPRRLNAFRPSGEHLIDLGFYCDVTTDMEGQPAFVEVAAVLCETCGRELASMIGYADPEVVAHTDETLAYWKERAETAEKKLDEMNELKTRLSEVLS